MKIILDRTSITLNKTEIIFDGPPLNSCEFFMSWKLCIYVSRGTRKIYMDRSLSGLQIDRPQNYS